MRKLGVVLAVLSAMGWGGDWPVSRGNSWRTGASDGAMPAELSSRWRFQASGAVVAEPVAAWGLVCVATTAGFVYGLELDQGKTRWSFRASGSVTTAAGIFKGQVVFADDHGFLYALDAETGIRKWRRELGGIPLTAINFSPAGVLLALSGGRLKAFSLKRGRFQWQSAALPPVGSFPLAGDRLILADVTGWLRWLDSSAGAVVLQRFLDEPPGEDVAYDDGLIFVAGSSGRVMCLEEKSGFPVWQTHLPVGGDQRPGNLAVGSRRVFITVGSTLYALNCGDGRTAWDYRSRSASFTRPLAARGAIALGDDRGRIQVVNEDTGRRIATFRGEGAIVAPPILASGSLFFGTVEGLVYRLGPSAEP